MKIVEIVNALNAKVLCGSESLDHEIEYAFASDLMSDVLTINDDKILLITGLINLQTIRTAEMLDINCILYVRNKTVTPEMIDLATDKEIVLLECPYSMFKTSGILYDIGVNPVY